MNTPTTEAIAPPSVVEPGQSEVAALDRVQVGPYLWLTVQLGLLLGVAMMYQIELERGFGVVAPLTLVGFILHCWFPLRWRLPFFLVLTATATVVLLEWNAVWLIALGLVLIGLCHLPASWPFRLSLVITAALGLAVLQMGLLDAPWAPLVIPILGSMFMFRLILYLYDLKADQTPASIWQRLAYFFMLPNLCFPLFPVVDYKTFLASYYDAPAAEIYQKGMFWILRGIAHLMLYRLVYYYFLPAADSSLSGIVGVYVFMAMTYALYLRVSGLFHLITGILCLFGFNLPVTNNHYFLASSFSDLWRRINIYWKDFMMTVVFYPVFMGTRRWSMNARLMSATGLVFLVTWFLHSYQWFWLQGVFPITRTDVAFWGSLGIALAINSIWEASRGRNRRLAQRELSWRRALGVSFRTLGVFSAMAILWTLWDSGSFGDWWYRLLRIRETTTREWLVFASLMGSVIVIGTAVQLLAVRGWGLTRAELLAWRHAPRLIPVTALGLIILWFPSIHERVGKLESAVVLAQSSRLNSIDALRQERGYYETLSRTEWLNPPSSGPGEEEAVPLSELGVSRSTNDLRAYVLVPSAATIFKGADFTTNRWGLRDREYDREKPPGIFRIALIGSSHVMGSGVGDEETFENVLEDRLNESQVSPQIPRYEILNFAVGGYGLLQTLYVVDQVVPQFHPDVVMYVVHPGEERRFVQRLRRITNSRISLGPEYQYVMRTLSRAGAVERLPESEFMRRLEPYQGDLLRWAFEQKIQGIRKQGALPVFVYLPLTDTRFKRSELRSLSRIAEENGALNVFIDDVYSQQSPDDIRVGEWDNHPNVKGHRLIAARLYRELIDNSQVIGRKPALDSAEQD